MKYEEIKRASNPPPNYKEIQRAFPACDFERGQMFAYSPNIHAKDVMPQDWFEHESTHVYQQNKFGGAKEWWDEYISNPKFRMEQEAEAYQVQYRFLKRFIKDRNQLNRRLIDLAKEFSSPLYGNVVSYNLALELIQK